MRIGILTGGGDVPGLNPCIKSIVNHANKLGWETIGYRRGWGGLLNINPLDKATISDHSMKLDQSIVRNIERVGGTILHTSRTNPGKATLRDMPEFLGANVGTSPDQIIDCTGHITSVLDKMEIDALIVIGGDDTLSYAARLHDEGVNVIGCPKTMDNDVFGTDYCIGFGTAVSRSVELIDTLRTPASSHERIAVVELFGRNSGETALIAGHLSAADRTLISEVPVDADRLAELVLADKRSNPANYAIIVVSEGARLSGKETAESGKPDAFGHRKLGGIGQIVGDALNERTGQGIINQSLAYLMRAGPPVALDRMVASAFGAMAVQSLEAGESGLMMALRDGNYDTVPVDISIKGEKRVDVAELYDESEYRPLIRNVRTKPMFLY